ncbi:hypothetical protein ACWEYY_00330 [Staphylococcus xylosus]
MIESKVIIYYLNEYKIMLNQLRYFAEWQIENKDKNEWEYTGKLPTKAKLKRTRMILNELMMKIES